jgi:hypothetical protein
MPAPFVRKSGPPEAVGDPPRPQPRVVDSLHARTARHGASGTAYPGSPSDWFQAGERTLLGKLSKNWAGAITRQPRGSLAAEPQRGGRWSHAALASKACA